MIISLFYLCLFLYLLKRCKSQQRVHAAVTALALYTFFILGDQIYLYEVLGIPFHPSDPSSYYLQVGNKSLTTFLKAISEEPDLSNVFYRVVNWYYFHGSADPIYNSILLYITNSLVFLCAYFLAMQEKEEFSKLELLLLLHPYLVMTLIRNVRDAHIIFFLVLYTRFLVIRPRRLKHVLLLLVAAAAMYYLRSFMLVPMGLMFLITIATRMPRTARIWAICATVAFSCISAWVLREQLTLLLINKCISTYLSTRTFLGGNDSENYEAFSSLKSSASISGSFLTSYVKSVLKALPSLLLFPHPFRYIEKATLLSKRGIYNIYTTVDSALIFAGGLVNYLLVIPIVMKLCSNVRLPQWTFLFLGSSLYMIYTALYMGVADLRIIYTIHFFILVSFILGGMTLNKKDYKFLGLSILGLLIGIFL